MNDETIPKHPTLKERWRVMRSQIDALRIAYRDPRTPWYARAWLALVLAYALSPIDLIPDFIPILGHLDDVILIPLGVWIALRLIPASVWEDARRAVQSPPPDSPQEK